jgi:hypothetical protein
VITEAEQAAIAYRNPRSTFKVSFQGGRMLGKIASKWLDAFLGAILVLRR